MFRCFFVVTLAYGASAMLEESQSLSSLSLGPAEDASINGTMAELSEQGYSAVASLHNDAEMRTFMLRAIAQQGLQVASEPRLGDIVPYFSGACSEQSYEALLEELKAGASPTKCLPAWLEKAESSSSNNRFLSFNAGEDVGMLSRLFHNVFSARAPSTEKLLSSIHSSFFGGDHIGLFAATDELGYLAVANADDPHEMFLFVKRVLKEEGLVVTKLKMLERMLPYYDGSCDTQSLSAMKTELHKAVFQPKTCFGGPWVRRA